MDYMFQPKETDWLNRKPKPLYMLSTRDPPQTSWHTHIESEGWKEIFRANGNQKWAPAYLLILVSDKIDFKIKRQGRALQNDQELWFSLFVASLSDFGIRVMVAS